MPTCKIDLPDSPRPIIVNKNSEFRTLHVTGQNEFHFLRLINTFFISDFCPKVCGFSWKMISARLMGDCSCAYAYKQLTDWCCFVRMDDDFCVMKYIEIVPLDNFNNFPDVTHIKQEPDTVEVYLIYVLLLAIIWYHYKYFTIDSIAKWFFCPSCAMVTAAFFLLQPCSRRLW